MKIDDVSLTIFTWDNIPATNYHTGTATIGNSNLGLLRIRTDAGLEGHAFLGSATNPASMDGPQLIRSLKPMLMGKDPLEREKIHAGMRLINRAVSYRTIGAVGYALWDLGKIAGMPVHALMGAFRNSIPAYASSQEVLPDIAAYVDQAVSFKQAGWQACQNPPTQGSRPGHQSLQKPSVRRSATTIASCWIRHGHMITWTPCASAARSRKWAIIGSRIRWRTKTFITTSNCARS